MTVGAFIEKLKETSRTISFQETIEIIDTYYDFKPSEFTNGNITNRVGENSGSCKVFSFGKLHKLNKEETLSCFGSFYTDVLNTPEGNDHQNIRNFIKTGWEEVFFKNETLFKK